MSLLARLLTAAFTVGLCASALGSGSIKLSAKPEISLADGQSSVVIEAEVRSSNGDLAPDGTPIRFSTTLGTFRDADSSTHVGMARATLVAPDTPGVAKVTATSPTIGTINTLNVEFVGDRAQLDVGRQFVEVSSDASLFYSNDLKLIVASAEDRSATLKFRDIEISAKDMQVDLTYLKVVATDAVIKIGDVSLPCEYLRYNLGQRKGVAIATVEGRKGGYDLTGIEATLSTKGIMPREFEFADVGKGTTSIHASKIVAFPYREIQFHDARLYVGDTKLMSLKLYALDPNSPSGLFSDYLVGFENGGLQLNYPYYLSLSPTHTSLLRLRSGQDYARGSNASRGVFLDWENTYMMSDKGEGSLTLAGIGRTDMGLSWHHSQRFDEKTSLIANVDFPGFKGLYGGVNASRLFNGFSANFTASSARSFRGTRYESQRADFNLETNMKKIGDLPLMEAIGLTASSSRAALGPTETAQEGYGIRSRLLLTPQRLWKGGNLSGNLTLTQLWGRKAGQGLNILGKLAIATPLGSQSTMQLSYDYAQDALNTPLSGRHRLTGEFFLDTQKYGLNLFASKGLDINSYSLFADASYYLSTQWRLGASLSTDRYLKSIINEHTLILGYRIGQREIGITYSISSNRFGFELMNVPIH
jgi:hypothetical protein